MQRPRMTELVLHAIRLSAFVAVTALAVGPAAAQGFQNVRWQEDWSDVEGRALKNIELADGVALDIGGDARWKPEAVNNPRYALSALDDDSWLQQRLLIHGNLRVGESLRAFVELGAYDVIDRRVRGSSDDNRYELSQAFIDVSGTLAGADTTLRIGRQELPLHDRFLDISDSSNNRQRFDGARLMLTHGDWRFEAMSVRPVEIQTGAFDDPPANEADLYGASLTRAFGDIDAQIFVYDYARRNFSIAGATANDRRRTWGVNVQGDAAGFDFELEGVRQTGDFGAQEVEAWAGFAQIGRAFGDAPWSPRLAARVTAGSGDSDPLDATQESYAPPFPRGSWFNEAGAISHSNIVEAAAVIEVKPLDDVTADLKLAGLWRANDGDFVYASPHSALAGTRAGDTFIGFAPRAQAQWRINANTTLRGQLAYVAVSDDLEAVGGEDLTYANASIAFRF